MRDRDTNMSPEACSLRRLHAELEYLRQIGVTWDRVAPVLAQAQRTWPDGSVKVGE